MFALCSNEASKVYAVLTVYREKHHVGLADGSKDEVSRAKRSKASSYTLTKQIMQISNAVDDAQYSNISRQADGDCRMLYSCKDTCTT